MDDYNKGHETCGHCDRDDIILDPRMGVCLDCADIGEDATPEGGVS